MPLSEAQKAIRAKRAHSTQKAIKAKVARGEATGRERAVIRLGRQNTRTLTGQEDLSTWDDEELRRGQRKDKNGRFQGSKPKIVPKAIHDELVKRTLSRTNQKLLEATEDLTQILIEIAKGQDVDEKDRLRAIQMVYDRVLGKAPDKLEVKSDTPAWQIAVNAGIVRIRREDIDPGYTGEDDDDEEDDDEEE